MHGVLRSRRTATEVHDWPRDWLHEWLHVMVPCLTSDSAVMTKSHEAVGRRSSTDCVMSVLRSAEPSWGPTTLSCYGCLR